MPDVIEFKPKSVQPSQPMSEVTEISNIVDEIKAQEDKISEVFMIVKTKEDDYMMYHTSSLSLPDRSFIIQLLQNEISNELNDVGMGFDEQ